MATATAGMKRKLRIVDAHVSRPRNRSRENAYAAGVPTTRPMRVAMPTTMMELPTNVEHPLGVDDLAVVLGDLVPVDVQGGRHLGHDLDALAWSTA